MEVVLVFKNTCDVKFGVFKCLPSMSVGLASLFCPFGNDYYGNFFFPKRVAFFSSIFGLYMFCRVKHDMWV